MSKVKKVLCSIFAVFVANIVLIKNVVFADVAAPEPIKQTDYLSNPFVLMLILFAVVFIVGISIAILMSTYRKNRYNKETRANIDDKDEK